MENTVRNTARNILKNILKNLEVSSLILALVACAAPTSSNGNSVGFASLAGDGSSGISGKATLGPQCPVVSVDNPCPDKPYAATLIIRASSGMEGIIKANENGEFRQDLMAGEYQMIPQTPNAAYPRASEQKITVQKGQFTIVNVTYDTGIR